MVATHAMVFQWLLLHQSTPAAALSAGGYSLMEGNQLFRARLYLRCRHHRVHLGSPNYRICHDLEFCSKHHPRPRLLSLHYVDQRAFAIVARWENGTEASFTRLHGCACRLARKILAIFRIG